MAGKSREYLRQLRKKHGLGEYASGVRAKKVDRPGSGKRSTSKKRRAYVNRRATKNLRARLATRVKQIDKLGFW